VLKPRANGTEGHPRATIFAVLLLPAIAFGAFSWWTFEAKWIGVVVLVVGVVIAAVCSTRPVKTTSLALLVIIQAVMLVATSIVGFLIDCARHCS
jgi:hypothetical protein